VEAASGETKEALLRVEVAPLDSEA
jgi:hypothetical protein